MMNLYLAVSEQLTYVECEDPFVNACHEEPYCIAELVVARNRSQATYLAWQHDNVEQHTRSHDMRDKPKFRVELKERDVEGPPRIASDEREGSSPESEMLWSFKDEEA
jgi:hypothetical protein